MVQFGAAPKASLRGTVIRHKIRVECGGKLQIIACIENPAVIEKVLKHMVLDEASKARNSSPQEGLFLHSIRRFWRLLKLVWPSSVAYLFYEKF